MVDDRSFYSKWTECEDFTWGVSDCEELVGSVTGDDVVGAAEVSLNEPYI